MRSAAKTQLTSHEIRHFFGLLQMAHYDWSLEQTAAIQYFIDADVAVRVIAGFEEGLHGTNRQQLFRSLLACGQAGKFRVTRPHALEIYEYIERKNREEGFDHTYSDLANAHIEQTGVDKFLEDLSEIQQRSESNDVTSKRECIDQFISVLKEAGEEKFAAIEVLRGPWKRRLKSFYSQVLMLDALGPKSPALDRSDLRDVDRILRYLERHSNRSHASNYRDARALALLARAIRLRIEFDHGPLVRFYSETPVMRKACEKTSELAELFDEKRAIQAAPFKVAPPKQCGVFRDADYFVVRIRFPEVGFSGQVQGGSLDELMGSLREIGVDNLREEHLTHLERHLEDGLGGSSLAGAIVEFEDLRLVRAAWTRDLLRVAEYAKLAEWTPVFSFARGRATREVLDEEIDDIQKELRDRVSQLRHWFADYDQIRRVVALHREGEDASVRGGRIRAIVEQPVRELGLDRWGVRIADADLEKVKRLITELHDPDTFVWRDSCRSCATLMQKAATGEARRTRIVCCILWLLREYRWMCKILDNAISGMKAKGLQVPADLVVWRGAAWARGASRLENESGADAFRECAKEIMAIETMVSENTAPLDQAPLLKLGLAYVLYHCWKRVDPKQLDDEDQREEHRGWVETSLEISEKVMHFLPENTLRWGLAANHCTYVGMVAGRDVDYVMSHMEELIKLEEYGIWTARFADTAACYYMWRFEQASGDGADVVELTDHLETAKGYLRDAQRRSIGDIAVNDHKIRWERLKVQLQKLSISKSTGTNPERQTGDSPLSDENE